MRRRSRTPGSAFTLVEVVLSLGIISFALAGIFGLLSAAATSTSYSDRDTMVVSMSTHVLNTLRATPFDNLWSEDPLASAQVSSQPIFHDSEPADSLYFFSAEGLPLQDDATRGVVYLCRVRKTVDRETNGYARTAENALDLQLTFSWPVTAPEANRRVQNIYAKISRY